MKCFEQLVGWFDLLFSYVFLSAVEVVGPPVILL